MVDLSTVRRLLSYSDWANRAVLDQAKGLTEAQLDKPFEIGRGTLRKLLLHIYAGEYVWLQRWQEHADTPWIDETEPASVASILERFEAAWTEREAFFEGLDPERLERPVRYRDSLGDYFQARLGDMLMQGIVHSVHHRAQAVNVLRRLGAAPPELDYMMWMRQPAPEARA